MIMNEKELLKYISLERMLYNYDLQQIIFKLEHIHTGVRHELVSDHYKQNYWLIKDLEKLLIQ